MANNTFYWHDYETFGTSPALDRPSQFAGIRTDQELNVIGDPLVIYCKPAADVLPNPEACLITGISPQLAREKGLPEAEFIARIHAEMAVPGTCTVGYNSIRFDDEVTRYTLYRNFYDPYAREWQNGNSRWDLIDMVRVCCALRPAGIEWPRHDDGTPSFKLEHITAANGISHEAAHDALSDVLATIAVAKLLKQKQPKLFDYLLQLRDKRKVMQMIDLGSHKPLLHTSSMFGGERYCTTLVMPLAMHPSNKNAVISYDLSVDPTPLIDSDAATIRERLYTPQAQLPEGVARIPLKAIHSNRCPVVATSKLLDDDVAARIHLDLPAARRHYQQLRKAQGLEAKLQQVFADNQFSDSKDPDVMLYGGGFFSAHDKSVMEQVRGSMPDQLREQLFNFQDQRLPEMLFRYRARNFPDSLTSEEQLRWQDFCFERLTNPEAGASLVMDDYQAIIEQKQQDPSLLPQQRQLLDQLLEYGDELLM